MRAKRERVAENQADRQQQKRDDEAVDVEEKQRAPVGVWRLLGRRATVQRGLRGSCIDAMAEIADGIVLNGAGACSSLQKNLPPLAMALAARQMHAAMLATHHVLGDRRARRVIARNATGGTFPGTHQARANTKMIRSNLLTCSPANRCIATGSVKVFDRNGRGERIRTSDSCVPNAVLYQAELHPDLPHYQSVQGGTCYACACSVVSRYRKVRQL